MVAVLEKEKTNRIFSKMTVKERKQLHADFYVGGKLCDLLKDFSVSTNTSL